MRYTIVVPISAMRSFLYIKLADLKQFYELMDIPTVITDTRFEVIWNNSCAEEEPLLQTGNIRSCIVSTTGADRLLRDGQSVVLSRLKSTSHSITLNATPVGGYVVIQKSNSPSSASELSEILENINRSISDTISLLPAALQYTDGDLLAVSTIDRINHNCLNVMRTTQNLSVFTKLVNMQGLKNEKICISALLATITESCNIVSENSPQSVPIRYKEPSEPLYINCDAECLLVALLNIIYNSMIYTQDENEIHLICTKIGQRLSIIVSDSGLGIKPELLSKVSNPFYSAHPCYADEERPGVGLGLGIVKELVGLYGGTFNIESRIFEGTKILLSFPIVQAPMELKQPRINFKSLVLNKTSALYIQLFNICEQ